MASETILTLFDKTQVNRVEPAKEHTVIAKEVMSENRVSDGLIHSHRYWLKTVANRLVNPSDFTLYELKKNDSKFVEVDEKTYKTYQDVINLRSVVPLRSLETRVNNA